MVNTGDSRVDAVLATLDDSEDADLAAHVSALADAQTRLAGILDTEPPTTPELASDVSPGDVTAPTP